MHNLEYLLVIKFISLFNFRLLKYFMSALITGIQTLHFNNHQKSPICFFLTEFVEFLHNFLTEFVEFLHNFLTKFVEFLQV